jgi:hypothetical protein
VEGKERDSTGKLTSFVRTADTAQLVRYIQKLQQASVQALDTNKGATEVKRQEIEINKAVVEKVRGSERMVADLSKENHQLLQAIFGERATRDKLQEELKLAKERI